MGKFFYYRGREGEKGVKRLIKSRGKSEERDPPPETLKLEGNTKLGGTDDWRVRS